jgi:hypothetical protein
LYWNFWNLWHDIAKPLRHNGLTKKYWLLHSFRELKPQFVIGIRAKCPSVFQHMLGSSPFFNPGNLADSQALS